MTSYLPKTDRNILPRWRSLLFTSQAEELRSHQGEDQAKLNSISSGAVSARLMEFTRSPGIHTAADLLATSLDNRDSSAANEAVKYLESYRMDMYPALQRLVGAYCRLNSSASSVPKLLVPTEIQELIHSIKRVLQLNPSDAILRVELSRLYNLLGQKRSAVSAMEVSLGIAQENRFVVRAASRLYMHLEDHERARHVLVRSGMKADPWIVATELAVSTRMGVAPRFWKHASKLLKRDIAPFHLAELNTAVSKLEAQSGGVRKARRFAEQAMVDPTENVIAQVEWLTQNCGLKIDMNSRELLRRSSEAMALNAYEERDYDAAARASLSWQIDQPFTRQPAMMGSFVNSVFLGRHEDALHMLRIARQSNPSDPMIHNNMAFSYINLDRFEEARRALSKMSACGLEPRDESVYLATRGLLLLREGDLAGGAKCYDKAIESFAGDKDVTAIVYATYFYAKELFRQGIDRAAAVVGIFNKHMVDADNNVVEWMNSDLRRISSSEQVRLNKTRSVDE